MKEHQDGAPFYSVSIGKSHGAANTIRFCASRTFTCKLNFELRITQPIQLQMAPK